MNTREVDALINIVVIIHVCGVFVGSLITEIAAS